MIDYEMVSVKRGFEKLPLQDMKPLYEGRAAFLL